MKLRTLLPFVALCACAVPEDRASAGGPAEPPAAGREASLLTAYHWKLESAVDAQGKRLDAFFPGPENRLTLTFEDGNVAVSGGCNRMSGRYALDSQGRLEVTELRSTLMACAPALMAADRAVTDLLSRPLELRVDAFGASGAPGASGASEPARLKLASPAGHDTTWLGEPTVETRFGAPGERVFLEVAPERVSCGDPVAPERQCLRVREVQYDEQGARRATGDWRVLHEDIEGFEFHPGERTVLRLDKFLRAPGPAGASAVVYVLDMIVESELVSGGQER